MATGKVFLEIVPWSRIQNQTVVAVDPAYTGRDPQIISAAIQKATPRDQMVLVAIVKAQNQPTYWVAEPEFAGVAAATLTQLRDKASKTSAPSDKASKTSVVDAKTDEDLMTLVTITGPLGTSFADYEKFRRLATEAGIPAQLVSGRVHVSGKKLKEAGDLAHNLGLSLLSES